MPLGVLERDLRVNLDVSASSSGGGRLFWRGCADGLKKSVMLVSLNIFKDDHTAVRAGAQIGVLLEAEDHVQTIQVLVRVY